MANFFPSDRLAGMAVRAWKTTSGLNTIEYNAVAAPGSLTSAAVWAISKTTTVTATGDLVSVQWADGNNLRDNIADNYAGLTYA